MIFRFIRTSKVNEWLKNHSPGSLGGTPGDNWRKFLKDNGGTGEGFHDLEQSYLATRGGIGGTIHDRWSAFTVTNGFINGKFTDRLRAYFAAQVAPSTTFYYLTEDGSYYLTEDGFRYIVE